MTDKAVIADQDIEELDVAPELPEAEDEPNEGENEAAPDDTEEEELIVTIGEETPPPEEADEKRAPKWLREVRQQNRELKRENRELKQLTQQARPREQEPQLGPKPTLEACDYDAELFERRLDAWKERKIIADRQAAEAKETEAKRQEYFNSKFEAYSKRKAEVINKIKDFPDVEETVLDALNDTQRGVVLAHAKDPALLLYAIGKDEKRLQELAKLSDPVEFIFAVARMETQMRTQSRKPASAPETRITGSAPSPGSETQLNKLREQAEKTGDYTKVVAYKKQLKEKRGS